MVNHSPIGLAVTQPTPIPDDLIEVGRVLGAYGLKGALKIQPFSPDADSLLQAKKWWLASATSTKPVLYQVKTAKAHSSAVVATLSEVQDRDEAEALKSYRISVSRADFPQTQSDEYYWVDLIGCDVLTDSVVDSVADSIKAFAKDTVATSASATATISATATSTTIISGTAKDTTFVQAQDLPAKSSNETSTALIQTKIGVVDQVLDNVAHAVLSVRQQYTNEAGQWVDKVDAKGRPVTMLIPFVAAHVTEVDLKARRIQTNWPLDF